MDSLAEGAELDALMSAPATRQARAVREREVSAAELVAAHLERLDALQPQLRAMLHVRRAEALVEAGATDAALAQGAPAGPLLGVPFTAKDNIDTAGVETLMGVREPAGLVPSRDAVVVARMRAAGAILLGKTAIVSPHAGFGSDELVHGRVANPYELRRSPGGSSGGEAAVIASCGSPCGLGNDSGGSLRTPAHFCGLATLKPTAGLVPMTGDEGALSDPRTQTGALARSVADVAAITTLIAGPDPRHPEVAPAAVGDPTAVPLPGLRVAVLADNGLVAPSDDLAATLADAAAALREAGLSVRDEPHPPGGHELTLRVWMSYRCEIGSEQLYDLLAEWDAYRVRMLEWFTTADVVLCPVYDRPALLPDEQHEQDDDLGLSYTTPYSLTGWPCAVVRCGTSTAGLPIGVQVVAHPWHDHVALAVAAVLERELGGWMPPPVLEAPLTWRNDG
jgi:amidase